MFKVVADVEAYPSFLPWVVGLRVLSREQLGDREFVNAEMAVGYGALREKYISRVAIDHAARTIDVAQTSGPFRKLENHWRFTPRQNGCQIDFSIAYEFKNRLLNALAGTVFGKVYVKMADAFEMRARELSDQAMKQI